MPPGFYYRRFRRSPRLFAAFERGLAHVAGQGRLPSAEAAQRLAAARCRAPRRRRRARRRRRRGRAERRRWPPPTRAAASCSSSRTTGSAAGSPTRPAPRRCADPRRAGARLTPGSRRSPAPRRSAGTRKACVAVDRRPDLLLVRPAAVVLATGGVRPRPAVRRLGPAGRHDSPAGAAPPPAATRRAARLASRRPHDGRHRPRRRRGARARPASRSPAWPTAGRRRRSGRASCDDVAAAGIAVITGVAGARAHGARRVTALSLLTGATGRGPRCGTTATSCASRPACDRPTTSSTRRWPAVRSCSAAGPRPVDGRRRPAHGRDPVPGAVARRSRRRRRHGGRGRRPGNGRGVGRGARRGRTRHLIAVARRPRAGSAAQLTAPCAAAASGSSVSTRAIPSPCLDRREPLLANQMQGVGRGRSRTGRSRVLITARRAPPRPGDGPGPP